MEDRRHVLMPKAWVPGGLEATDTGMMALIAFLLLIVVLTGCTGPVELRYPDGRVVQCGPYAVMDSGSEALREAQCIDDHRAQGATRL